ncbi:hypothetical protein [Coleofasciculus sp. G2-EDA-02]|uniref:hypothetical protein n=1 Tax=Coleofasciculus sp. G2-EDA-02 TaxID=3069529 RepID=UPI0032F86214
MTNDFITLELRWFNRGILPTKVNDWFATDCPGETLGLPETREDICLYIPDCPYLNIKFRQGSLEVKWRKAELGMRQFGGFGEGSIEQWIKWSCQDSTSESLMPKGGLMQGSWVQVKKARSQRFYQEITYELTQLTVNNENWWTIAFEALVEVDTMNLEEFEQGVSEIGQTYQGLSLQNHQSCAYPSWLNQVV